MMELRIQRRITHLEKKLATMETEKGKKNKQISDLKLKLDNLKLGNHANSFWLPKSKNKRCIHHLTYHPPILLMLRLSTTLHIYRYFISSTILQLFYLVCTSTSLLRATTSSCCWLNYFETTYIQQTCSCNI